MKEDFPLGLGLGLSATFKESQLCLWKNRKIEKTENFVSSGIQTQLLFRIRELLQKSGYSFENIEFIIVDTGPAESFTGLRLSLALVKSWLFVCPSIGLYTTSSTSLLYGEVLQKFPEYYSRIVVVGYFGFQQRVYLQAFKENCPLETIQDLPFTEIPHYLSSYHEPLLTGNFLRQPFLDSPPYERLLLNTPRIEYIWEPHLTSWRDLSPRYYRKTQAEEQADV